MHSASLILVALAVASSAFAAEGGPTPRDHQAILAMAGEYKVNFGFDETLTLAPDAQKSEPFIAHGHEKVIIVEDRGNFISLQHLLIVGKEDEQQVVKHWRQDWQYEPEKVLLFRGDNTWTLEAVPEDERRGAWSQTVYQVDDSPRYAGVARWKHLGDYSYWESNETWRPLPRREAEVRKDYDVLAGRNRHSITPDGWAHEQDNLKIALHPEHVLAREQGLNTYRRDPEFDYSAATKYWEKTAPFWKEVRAWWNMEINTGTPIRYAQAQGDLAPHLRILKLADQFADGKLPKGKALHKVLNEALSQRLLLTQAQ